jgi:predicted  nucleic acid-binding Zn-ribbon protein
MDMSVSEELIKAVKVKVQDLAKRVDNLKAERNQLRSENDRLKNELGEHRIILSGKQSEIAELNRKLQEIKETETNDAESKNTEMRTRISELVHEIDRCIVMLNK